MSRGGRRAGAGRKPGGKSRRRVSLPPALAHRQMVEELPLDVLVAAMRDETRPIELRLAAVKAAPLIFMPRFRAGRQRPRLR